MPLTALIERRFALRSAVSILAIMFAVALAAGCKDSEPAAAPPKPKKSDRAKAQDDSAAMQAFLAKKGDSSASGSNSSLPAGHPPVPGMSSPPAASSNNGLPKGHPPLPSGMRIAGGASGTSAPPTPAPAPRLPLKFTVPESWTSVVPSSSMRKAQFEMPHADSDTDDGHMVVYYFGAGQGGGVQANIDRWIGQFSTADGKPIPESDRVVNTLDIDGLKVTTLDVAGKYTNTMMGAGAGTSDGMTRMLGAIVETPSGPWFFKGTGPVDTMAKNKPAFEALIKSLSWKEDDGTGGA